MPVLILIAKPGRATIDAALLKAVARAGGVEAEPRWLGEGEACDIPLPAMDRAKLRALEDSVRRAVKDAPIDVAVVPGASRRKKLLVADMDSTIIEQECLDEIADFAGLKSRVAAITERAMRGELVFETALRERVGLLKGLDSQVLERVIAERITLTPGADTLVHTMRAHGATAVLVSGGFSFFTSRVAVMAGFEHDRSNELLIENGALTGRVSEPILGREAKLESLRKFRDELGVRREDTLAVGDGANDLAMIKEAGLGVAFRAKPVVAAKADVRIDHCDLTALLYLQGYRKDEFVE